MSDTSGVLCGVDAEVQNCLHAIFRVFFLHVLTPDITADARCVSSLIQASDYLTTEEFMDAISGTLKMNLITYQTPRQGDVAGEKLSNSNWEHYAASEHNSSVVSGAARFVDLSFHALPWRHSSVCGAASETSEVPFHLQKAGGVARGR